jgi:C-terminal processing protease CtpA/Prc
MRFIGLVFILLHAGVAGATDAPQTFSPRQALLTIGGFYWCEKSQFYDLTRDAFARMKAAGTQTLVIDIRSNTGGDDDMWLEGIMPYIADKPYRNGSDYVLKVIEGHQKEGQKVGDVVRGSQSTHQPALDNPLHFTGKVYVLIGPATYSSAILFANAVQDYGFATVVGTGGAARAYFVTPVTSAAALRPVVQARRPAVEYSLDARVSYEASCKCRTASIKRS